MRRREFLGVLGSAVAWPVVARAQSRPVIGFIGSGSRNSVESSVAGFLEGLKRAGFVDGRNLTIEYRWAEGKYERLPIFAAELVRRPVAVIFAAQGNVSALAARQSTSTIPIVFVTSDDPVATGLVASLNRPGGNLTGVSRLGTVLAAKNLELVHELLPKVSVIGLLVNPKRPTVEAQLKRARDTANTIGKTIRVLNASDEREIDEAFRTASSERIAGLVVAFDGLFNIHRAKIVALAERYLIPTAYSLREFVSVGGLMSYGDDAGESYELGGGLVARILKGAKPADLPVEQVTKVGLSLNLKTAKSLGLTVPLPLLGRADEVIE